MFRGMEVAGLQDKETGSRVQGHILKAQSQAGQGVASGKILSTMVSPCVHLYLDKLSCSRSPGPCAHEVPGLSLLDHAWLFAGEGEGGAEPKEPHAASGPEAKLSHSCCRASSDTCPSADTLPTARENKEPISRSLPEILLQICCAIAVTFHTPWLSSTSLSVCQSWQGVRGCHICPPLFLCPLSPCPQSSSTS